MVSHSKPFAPLWLLVVFSLLCAGATASSLKSSTFLSKKTVLTPGLVSNKYFFDMEFPTGHIAVKSFTAEVVDEDGNSVPLYDTYLHHWVVFKFFHRQGTNVTAANFANAMQSKDFLVPNEVTYWGVGSETRKTATYVPDPYGIETGNPLSIPAGYEEKWVLNIHVIDTRGVVDKVGCLECRCDLYNVTTLPNGRPLPPGYRGGLSCCDDRYQCRLRNDFKGYERALYLRYTVKWVDWDTSILPVKMFAMDVTCPAGIYKSINSNCTVEYQVPVCNRHRRSAGSCVFSNRTTITMPSGGYLIYGVGHQHIGGHGVTLRGQDGRVLCASMPIYGRGNEPGNENGYVVGMSTCYPKQGASKIMDMETLVVESIYNNEEQHTGVMGVFNILVADRLPLE